MKELQEFATLREEIHAAGGVLRGVMSQSQDAATKAMADWKIPFPSIGDPSVSIAENLRKRGLLDIYVDVGKAKFYNKTDVPGRPLPGGRHKVSLWCPHNANMHRLKTHR